MPDLVVKVGGSLLATPATLDTVLAAIADAGIDRQIVIVPGGGPFADTVRALDRRLTLGDDTAHWMAVLGMDQYAHLIGSRLPRGTVVEEPAEIDAVAASDRMAVLAPFRWLRRVDPLPHRWDVTSDSIAAWVAGAVGATRLVLLKPPGAEGRRAVDPYFDQALPPNCEAVIVPADQVTALRAALQFQNRGARC